LPVASSGLPAGSGELPLNPATPFPAPPGCLPMRPCSRWGLPCRPRCRGRGGLLPRRFTLAAEAPRRAAAVCFLWHSPRRFRHRALPGIVLYGARTFLPMRAGCARSGDRVSDVDSAKMRVSRRTRKCGKRPPRGPPFWKPGRGFGTHATNLGPTHATNPGAGSGPTPQTWGRPTPQTWGRPTPQTWAWTRVAQA